jgi:DNA modification methylase
MTLPDYRDNNIWLMNGDCLERMAEIPHMVDVVAAVISDPPYGCKNNNDYTRFTKGPNTQGSPGSRSYPPTRGDQVGFDPTPWLQFPRVALWGVQHFAQRLPVGTILVWIKRKDGGFGTFLSDAELAWVSSGKGVYCRRDTSMYGVRNKVHPNQKPVGIMEWCIDRLKVPAGSTILDPYMGSGSTGVAAIRRGYRFIGIEIDSDYYVAAKDRILSEVNAQTEASGG